MTRIKAAALGLALLSAGSLAMVQPASARPFHGFGGGWHHGWHGGGWGFGAGLLGLGLGIAAANAFAGPYYDYGYYGYPYAWGEPAYGGCYTTWRWGPYGRHLVRVCY